LLDESLPRLFMPCREPKFSKRFANVEARQFGFEVRCNGEAGRYFTYRLGAAYTRADNLDLHEPLPEIPPLETTAALRYIHPAQILWIEINNRIVAKQNRIAESFSESTSPGFAVFDIRTALRLNRYIELNMSILNLFDKAYFEHLNRKYINMPLTGILYEPGRNFIVMLKLYY